MKTRNRYMIFFLIAAVLITTIFFGAPESTQVFRQSRGTILIDAGHGGFDGGAVGMLTNVREDVLNLNVAHKLKALFELNGYKVVMTRENNEAVASTKGADMARRREIIDNSHADAVISIHMNKFKDTSVSGPMAFYYEESDEGKKLAEIIQIRLNEYLDPPKPRTFKAEDYFILKSGESPCVLVECGFISNEREEELLQQDDYQEKCARAIYRGAVQYLGQRLKKDDSGDTTVQ
jgi:N-acetylmuramoyl-L-alanine amidase